MSEISKRVELRDEEIENVAGGVIFNQNCVINIETKQRYAYLNPDRTAAFGYVCQLGDIPEADKIAALQAAGYIGGEI